MSYSVLWYQLVYLSNDKYPMEIKIVKIFRNLKKKCLLI